MLNTTDRFLLMLGEPAAPGSLQLYIECPAAGQQDDAVKEAAAGRVAFQGEAAQIAFDPLDKVRLDC